MVLEIAYRYKGLRYLVSDKVGSLYLLPHFDSRRTVLLTKVKVFENENTAGTHKTIKYKRSNISFKQLRERKIEVNETLEYFVYR